MPTYLGQSRQPSTAGRPGRSMARCAQRGRRGPAPGSRARRSVDPPAPPVRWRAAPRRRTWSQRGASRVTTDQSTTPIAAAEAGDVIVVAAGGRREIAVIGELLGGAARRKGIAGVVVDGGVRDVATIRSWPDFHMFSRWITSRGPTTMERGAVNEPIVFGDVAVSPGDLVIGDDDGLVFVPHDLAESLLPACLARVDGGGGLASSPRLRQDDHRDVRRATSGPAPVGPCATGAASTDLAVRPLVGGPPWVRDVSRRRASGRTSPLTGQ